uniref:Retrotransposon Orf1 n=1 Tax=Tanacetum cinerariifolium TaxID=118510 RepID=A0A699HE63_TANCI|nr:retrotransposon Orf1 [Tanacetum cinerariifolium]
MFEANESIKDAPKLASAAIFVKIGVLQATIGDENPIHPLRDYSRKSHEGYQNTIELPDGNNVVPLRSDTIRLVQNGCSFHGLRTSTWKDLTTRFLAQFFLSGRTAKLRNDILMFQQRQGWVSNFMASQDAKLSKFEADFKQQQSKMANKIDTFLKAINDRMTGALSSDTVKNPKLNVNSTSSTFKENKPRKTWIVKPDIKDNDHDPIVKVEEESEESEEEEEEEEDDSKYINTNPSNPSISFITEKVCKLNSFLESLKLVPPSSNTQSVCIKENDEDIIFVEIIKKYDDSSEEEPEEDESVLEPKEDPEGIRGISNFTGRIRRMHIFIGNFTYVLDFMIIEDISSIIDPRLSQVVLGKPFVKISNMTHDLSLGIVKFANGTDEIAYKIPQKIEQLNLLSDLEKEHAKSIYVRNDQEKKSRLCDE